MRKDQSSTGRSTKFSKRELRLKRIKLRGNKCHFRSQINKQLNNNNDDNN
jgi:hypothetical protein